MQKRTRKVWFRSATSLSLISLSSRHRFSWGRRKKKKKRPLSLFPVNLLLLSTHLAVNLSFALLLLPMKTTTYAQKKQAQWASAMKEENEALHAAMASLGEKHEAAKRRSAEALAEAQGWLEEAQADAARFREEACRERLRVAELEREVEELKRREERAATKTEVVYASAFANHLAPPASFSSPSPAAAAPPATAIAPAPSSALQGSPSTPAAEQIDRSPSPAAPMLLTSTSSSFAAAVAGDEGGLPEFHGRRPHSAGGRRVHVTPKTGPRAPAMGRLAASLSVMSLGGGEKVGAAATAAAAAPLSPAATTAATAAGVEGEAAAKQQQQQQDQSLDASICRIGDLLLPPSPKATAAAAGTAADAAKLPAEARAETPSEAALGGREEEESAWIPRPSFAAAVARAASARRVNHALQQQQPLPPLLSVPAAATTARAALSPSPPPLAAAATARERNPIPSSSSSSVLPPPSQSTNVIGWRVVHPPPAPAAARVATPTAAATATRGETAVSLVAPPSASVVVTTAAASASPSKTSPTPQPMQKQQHSAVGRAAAAVLHRLSPLRRAGGSSERGEKN